MGGHTTLHCVWCHLPVNLLGEKPVSKFASKFNFCTLRLGSLNFEKSIGEQRGGALHVEST
jgi:hypothetical protein